MGQGQFSYTLTNFASDFPKFTDSFKDFCKGLNESVLFDLEVSLEELVVNSFSYGSPAGPITITAELKDDGVVVVVKDKAPPFNLLREAPNPPTGLGLAERPVGGLGIHLVKNLNDRVEYTGSQNGNTVTLFKLNKKK